MKTMLLCSLFLSLAALSIHAQAAKSDPVLVTPQVTQKPKPDTNAPPLVLPKSTNAILGMPITFGGYITDLVRAKNKRALFDLKTPLDPQKDFDNIFFNGFPSTAQPVILFRIKF